MPERVTVGVDLGGTLIRVVARGSATWSRRLRAPAPTPDDLPEFLRRLWKRWRLSPRDVAALAVAARGVWTAAERRAEADRLRGLASRILAVPDAVAAYFGALGHRPGLLVLAGTGSIVLGRSADGRWGRGGGLGPLLGDEGSAFSIGREWLRALSVRTGIAQARRTARGPDAIQRVAALAPGVLRRARRGDRLASRVVADAQWHLAVTTWMVARQLGLQGPVAVSWAGSLMENRVFRDGVWRALRRQGLRLRVVPPAQSAVAAAHAVAAGLARRMAR